MSGDFPTSTLQVRDKNDNSYIFKGAKTSCCQPCLTKRIHRKNGLKLQQQFLQLIDEDVRHPHISGRYRNLFDLIKVFWVPDQEFIRPRLNCSRMEEVKRVKQHVNMVHDINNLFLL